MDVDPILAILLQILFEVSFSELLYAGNLYLQFFIKLLVYYVFLEFSFSLRGHAFIREYFPLILGTQTTNFF